MTAYLGIDTSCYTTSIAVANETQQILCNIKIPLEVAQGEKGLQQSQAVFLHIKNFQKFFDENSLAEYLPWGGVCVSEKPRPQNNSYMPVFTVGTMLGTAISAIFGMPIFYATHQEGHLSAAMIGKRMPQSFLAAHVSGGTTEILKIHECNHTFQIDVVGGTLDIAAGQVVDRLAQKMLLPFPGGKYLEQLAHEGRNLNYKTSVKECNINFSGLEAQALRSIEQDSNSDIAFSLLHSIAVSLEQSLLAAVKKTGISDILLFGGVMSNCLIRNYLFKKLNKVQFAEIEYSSDNAAGLAVLAAQRGNM